jgi:nicotinate-nucleotide--dimethylbenzimidazole phosphoribosyltransferase
MLARKVSVVEQAVRGQVLGPGGLAEPLGVLAGLGGFEIAGLVGFITGGAAAGVPVVVDGVIAAAALLAAHALTPEAVAYCFAGHRSVEPGSQTVLTKLGLTPLLDLGLRLGEGTGACLALPVLQAAAKIVSEMATFDEAGVSQLPEVGQTSGVSRAF